MHCHGKCEIFIICSERSAITQIQNFDFQEKRTGEVDEGDCRGFVFKTAFRREVVAAS